MIDLKEMYMKRAEEISMELHGVEFYNLKEPMKSLVYEQAERDVIDGVTDHADFLRKASKENC